MSLFISCYAFLFSVLISYWHISAKFHNLLLYEAYDEPYLLKKLGKKEEIKVNDNTEFSCCRLENLQALNVKVYCKKLLNSLTRSLHLIVKKQKQLLVLLRYEISLVPGVDCDTCFPMLQCYFSFRGQCQLRREHFNHQMDSSGFKKLFP